MIDYAVEYRRLHEKEDRFIGMSILPHVDDIAWLVAETGTKTLLDYGCGKGEQYTRFAVHSYWGSIMPTLYDIGVPEFSMLPKKKFDGVICTDVLEHIAVEDVKSVVKDLFRHAHLWVFMSICTRPAKKTFDDGRNVHLTVKSERWWRRKIEKAARGRRFVVRFVE